MNAVFSEELNDIGILQIRKIVLLARYCLEAIWCRFRYRAETLYYIPAPPKRIAFYRDCLVLTVCRPFFRHIVFHWEASGLGEWIQNHGSRWERKMAKWSLGSPELSITLAKALSHDAEYFASQRTVVVPNGITDPCPDFDQSILMVRCNRLRQRREATLNQREIYRVAYLAHCTREKGLFDALEATAIANQQLEDQQSAVRMCIKVAGAFLRQSERREFDAWRKQHPNDVEYIGFLATEDKDQLLRDSDCLCFPSYYSAEAQPISIVEAMAFGLTIVATAWRGIPELLPSNYPFLISNHDPSSISSALLQSMEADLARQLRLRYCESFTADHYVERLSRAFQLFH